MNSVRYDERGGQPWCGTTVTRPVSPERIVL
jgi:hypothetical protein